MTEQEIIVLNDDKEVRYVLATQIMGWRLMDYETGEYGTKTIWLDDASSNDGWAWEGQDVDSGEAWQWNPLVNWEQCRAVEKIAIDKDASRYFTAIASMQPHSLSTPHDWLLLYAKSGQKVRCLAALSALSE